MVYSVHLSLRLNCNQDGSLKHEMPKTFEWVDLRHIISNQVSSSDLQALDLRAGRMLNLFFTASDADFPYLSHTGNGKSLSVPSLKFFVSELNSELIPTEVPATRASKSVNRT